MRFFSSCLASALLMVGCAHSPFQGSVTEKIGDDQAEVHLTGSEPKPGEKVEFFTSKCRKQGGRNESEYCKRIPVGEGEVIKPLSEHDALVRIPTHSKIASGTFAEKKEVPEEY